MLENHHLALAFNIMQHASCAVFAKWSPEAEAQARKFIIAAVLATDMDAHASLQDELRRRAAHTTTAAATAPGAGAGAGAGLAFDPASDADRLALAKCLLHAADIANPSRPFGVCARISMLAIQEFQQQAEEEAVAGLSISPHMVFPSHESKCRRGYWLLAVLRAAVLCRPARLLPRRRQGPVGGN